MYEPTTARSRAWSTATAAADTAADQGLTLVHVSAQLERFLWDGGCA